MAKFMFVKFSLLAEITDADTLREAPSRNSTPMTAHRMTTPTPLTGTHRRKARRSAAWSPPRTWTP